MAPKDLIQDASHDLAYEEILTYIGEPALTRWQSINNFIQERYGVSPKITYSKCSAQKGWNVKYQKSGKSLCTLYPEKDNFIILVVIKLDLLPIIEAMADQFDPAVLALVQSSRPFNGTKWLMIPVDNEAILKSVQDLLILKHEATAPKKLKKGKRD